MSTWTIELPAGLPMLNANHRVHRMEKARSTATIRAAARDVALASGMPRLERAWVVAYIHPPRNFARWDPANYYPTVKAALDGVVDAGLLADDSHEYVSGPDMRPAPKVPKLGQLRLVFAAPSRCACGHDLLEHHGGPCRRPACGCTTYRDPAPEVV